MGELIASMSVSLDGYIAGPGHDVSEVFAWHQAEGEGVVELAVPGGGFTLKLTEKNAAWFRRQIEEVGAILCGRGLFDMVGGWGGSHPVGAPIVCWSRGGAPEGWTDERVTFVEDLAEAVAVAKKIAGDKYVGTAGSRFVQRLLDAGLLDGVEMSVVPVVLGDGIPFFGHGTTTVHFGPPTIEAGDGVTHLTYRVRR
ncbi:deaminase [Actinorhabdospora filicis]|uniref:Deaminase n=1 Tax=Actinorhabdospora filicis TaxID=1785913 RepID=A0A9W6W8U2_9ACTN|nr:dihydrofolate reductase family protein [Actinorhabdospora filicis]GLZ77333.1 deaminase [Actinorhabdospora filicis]